MILADLLESGNTEEPALQLESVVRDIERLLLRAGEAQPAAQMFSRLSERATLLGAHQRLIAVMRHWNPDPDRIIGALRETLARWPEAVSNCADPGCG